MMVIDSMIQYGCCFMTLDHFEDFFEQTRLHSQKTFTHMTFQWKWAPRVSPCVPAGDFGSS